MKDWVHATKQDIDNMSYEDMIEILEDHIEAGKRGGDFSPRAHTMKMYETCIRLLKEEIKRNKYKAESEDKENQDVDAI